MIAPTVSITTDLLTPLGAYLRLREGAARELPARVGRAGPARALLASSAAARGSSTSSEAEALRRAGRRLPRLRPRRASSSRRCRCPDDGPRPAREPLRRRRHARPLRPRARHRRGARRRPGRDRGAARRAAVPTSRRAGRPRARAARAARPGTTTSAACVAAKEHIRAGDAFQIVLSQRAERPTSASRARALPRAAARQPVAVPLPARARRPRARRLLARDARQVRGPPRER